MSDDNHTSVELEKTSPCLSLLDRMNSIIARLKEYEVKNVVFNEKDHTLLKRTLHLIQFTQDVIDSSYEDNNGFSSHYLKRFNTELHSLIHCSSNEHVSILDVSVCYNLCWDIVNDYVNGVVYDKPFWKTLFFKENKNG